MDSEFVPDVLGRGPVRQNAPSFTALLPITFRVISKTDWDEEQAGKTWWSDWDTWEEAKKVFSP